MANSIKCTCGHSWSKSSSSKKDMRVCHICGKDNTMEDGGWLSKYEQGGMVLKKKTKDNFGKKFNPNDVEVSVGPGFVGLGYNTKGRNYSPAWGGQFAMGGNLPGSVGFTYARVAGSAPANGKYTKKTKASAQNGKEMQFYQEGLDFKPKTISQNGSVIKDDRGQWAYPGEITEINSNDITMQGVDYPVLGISDTGDTQMMYPDQDYKFDGNKVIEYPMMQNGGGLSRFDLETMTALEKDIKNQKARNAQETVSQYTPKLGDQQRMNAAKDAYRAEQAKPLNRLANNPHIIAGDKNLPGAIEFALDVMTAGEAGAALNTIAKPALKAAGKYLTEKTALKNAYKLNPKAFRPTEGMMYRGLGKEGMEDALVSGVFRAKQNVEPSMVGRFNVAKQFNKAYFSPKFNVADDYGQGFIAEVPRAASDWGKRYARTDWSQIAQKDIPITEGKILQKDWLKRYKEVPENKSIKVSEIDWGKWNPEIPKNKKLMEEYIDIENSTKGTNTWMKNPDGSEFKGTPEQFVQQQSQNFKKAFGNSKLVNPDGSPIMLYHGAPERFDFFDPALFQRGDAGYSGIGIYTTPSKTVADSYAYSSRSFIGGKEHTPTVYELYGQANNPISSEQLVNEGGKRDLFNFNRTANWKGEIPVEERLTGYDAAIANKHPNVTNVRAWNDAYEIVFPKNTQLKSAIGNNGMFDMNNPNIYKALLPAVGVAGIAGASQKKNGGWLNKYK